MTTFQITHSRKDGPDPDRRIDAVAFGGYIYRTDQVIQWIESRAHSFYTMVFGRRAEVYVRQRGLLGAKYLTTSPDGFGQNNLLHLPNC